MDVKLQQISQTQLKLHFQFKPTEMQDQFQKFKAQTFSKISATQSEKELDPKLVTRIEQQTRSGLVARMMQDGVKKVVEKFKIKIVSQVDFKFAPWNEGESFAFTAQFEMNPKISSIKVPSVKFREEKGSVSNSLIDKSIVNLMRMQATIEEVGSVRKIKKGDIVVLDIDAFDGKKTSAEGSAKGFQIEIKESAKQQSFLEKQVIGLSLNDKKSFDYEYAVDFPSPLLAGKTIKFNITVVAVKKFRLPKLDASFVRKVFAPHDTGKILSPNFPKTVEDLRAFIRKELQFIDENKKFEQKKAVLLDKIISKNPFEIPKALHAVQKNSLIQFETQMLKSSGQAANIKDHLERKDGEITVAAEKMVRSALIVDFLARRNNIDCDDKDIEAFISDRCRTTGEDKLQILKRLSDPNFKSQMKYSVLENKVMQVVLKKVDKDQAA